MQDETVTYFEETIECHALSFLFSFTPRVGIFNIKQVSEAWRKKKKSILISILLLTKEYKVTNTPGQGGGFFPIPEKVIIFKRTP